MNTKTDCKYCHQNKDGGIDILKDTISCGEMGEIEIDINFKVSPWTINNGDLCMSIWAIGGSIDKYVNIAINYCPICGRDLRQMDNGA